MCVSGYVQARICTCACTHAYTCACMHACMHYLDDNLSSNADITSTETSVQSQTQRNDLRHHIQLVGWKRLKRRGRGEAREGASRSSKYLLVGVGIE